MAYTGDTHWSEVHALNVAVLEKVLDATPTEDQLTAADFVCRRWIFPPTALDRSRAAVDIADLNQKREDWIAREMGVPGW